MKQQISNLEAHQTLPIVISHELNSCIDLSDANFGIRNVANNTIKSNYDLSNEHEGYVLNVNKVHEQMSDHAEMIKKLHI